VTRGTDRGLRQRVWLLAAFFLLAVALIVFGVAWFARGHKASSATAFPDQSTAALTHLRAASNGPTNVAYENGFPVVVTTNVGVRGSNSIQRAIRFVRTYKDVYGQFMPNPFRRLRDDRNHLGIPKPNDKVRLYYRELANAQGKATSTPDLVLAVRGTQGAKDDVVALYQTYKGVEVLGGNLLVFHEGDRVLATVGSLRSDLDDDVRPRLTDREAEAAARKALHLTGAAALGRTELVIFDPSLLPSIAGRVSQPRLAWRVTLGGGRRPVAFVNAATGSMLHNEPQVQLDYSLDLETANGHNSVESDCYSDTTDDDSLGDEDGLNDDGEGDPEGVAMWGDAGQAYDFYLNTFGRDSFDDDGGEYDLYVHASTTKGSWWDGGCLSADFNSGEVAYDITVHELAHGVMEYGFFGGPGSSNQGGALAESYADTMAAIADGNWTIGEGRFGGGGAVRNLANPDDPDADGNSGTKSGAPGDPDQLAEWDTSSGDNGKVHRNSGIPSKAQFLLAAGGTHPNTGWTVVGIGKDNMGWLAYQVMEVLPDNSSFLGARGETIAWAYGNYPGWVVCSVRNAWAAVGVGNGDLNCDGVEEPTNDFDGDGAANGVDNCPLISNPMQKDTDGDGKGNVCDGDADEDGFPEYPYGRWAPGYDDCPGLYNPDQTDANLNGVGKACDPTEDDDFDDDSVPNTSDNCILDANHDQADVDNDGAGDACDPDSDGDGWSNDNDSCPFTYDPAQADADGDGVGDVCDACPHTADQVTAWTTGNATLGIDPHPVQPDCNRSFHVSGRLAGSIGLKDDSRTRNVDAAGNPGRFLSMPLSVSPAGGRTWFKQGERRTLTVKGVDPRVRMWIADDTGRTVARSKPRATSNRRLRFRPLGGRKYFLLLYFSRPYPKGHQERFLTRLVPGAERLHFTRAPLARRHS
jgi:Zn-dependent metalloprotease